MNNLRSRPKGRYILDADWQELYILTENLKSDLLFYKDDLRFLQHLIDKYFLWMSKKENIDKVRDVEVNLMEANTQCIALLKRTEIHLTHLANRIDDAFKYDSHKLRDEHESLEDDISNFVKTFRKNRKEILTITEYVIDNEKFVELIMNKKS